ncbi:hypothetical protein RhiJN_10360 [Ceratobasidium sp. AG-Ba]|nr:hypothetical protein RhiJN_10360 [Ceratobasidium sp. AG-Ba]
MPKTVFSCTPGEGSGHGRKRVSTSLGIRTKRLPISPVTQTKPLTSPTSTAQPLPTSFNAPTLPALFAGPALDIRFRTTGDKRLYAMGDRMGSTRGAMAWMLLAEGMGYGGVETVPAAEEPMQYAQALDVEKESAEQVEVVVEMEQKNPVQDAAKDPISVSVDIELDIAVPEAGLEKEKVAPAEPKLVALKKDPVGKL